jgi:hypothetical protein
VNLITRLSSRVCLGLALVTFPTFGFAQTPEAPNWKAQLEHADGLLRQGRGEEAVGRPSGAEDPMLRSGLLLAGANRALSGEATPVEREDGVLTAYEALGLNLHGTELVVLSACETGLGEIRNGEGVFGLRRALEVAGAQNVLMSLWSVPDRETQELMGLFYEKWLAGQTKHDALRAAQLEMRQRGRPRYGADRPDDRCVI